MDEMQPLQVPIKEAARLLGTCRQTLYRMREDGEIAFGRMRGRTLVPMAEILRIHQQLYPSPTPSAVDEAGTEPKQCRPKKIKLVPRGRDR